MLVEIEINKQEMTQDEAIVFTKVFTSQLEDAGYEVKSIILKKYGGKNGRRK